MYEEKPLCTLCSAEYNDVKNMALWEENSTGQPIYICNECLEIGYNTLKSKPKVTPVKKKEKKEMAWLKAQQSFKKVNIDIVKSKLFFFYFRASIDRRYFL